MLASGIDEAQARGGNIMTSHWWEGGLYFSCVRCGACCGREPGTVRFTGSELRKMAGALEVTEEQFTRIYIWHKYGIPSLREQPNYDCVFLKNTGGCPGCQIYPFRPSQCRTFPFWPEILDDKSTWDWYARSCPGMNNGEFHKFDEISKISVKYAVDSVKQFL